MAARAGQDFDPTPLAWVRPEIDRALAQAGDSLDSLAAAPADRVPANGGLRELHQVTGALAMLELGAAARYAEEFEKFVAYLQECPEGEIASLVPPGRRAIANLRAYLDALAEGGPDYPMALLPGYLELNRARGAGDAREGDLFLPDLDASLPGPLPGAAVDDTVLAKALSHQRSRFQQGMLRLLRGGEPAESLRPMQGAAAAIESLQPATRARPFWTAVAGYLDALALDGLAFDAGSRPLLARVDRQLKQSIDGTDQVPERLFRDVLLQVGRSRPVSARIADLKSAYRLDELLATPPPRPEAAGTGEATATHFGPSMLTDDSPPAGEIELQAGQQVLANLQDIEQVLDAFFRDPARRGEVAGLADAFARIHDALLVLESAAASDLNAAVARAVRAFAQGRADAGGEAAERVADAIAALGAYVSDMQQGLSPRPAMLRSAAAALETVPSGEPSVGMAAQAGDVQESARPVPVAAAEPDVDVGTVRLSPTLFPIFVGEAEQHAAVLEREMCALEADAARKVSHEFTRAAHTLAGSSRTTGFDVLADVAHALEAWLADAADRPAPFTPACLAAMRRAVDGATSMVRSIAARVPPQPREDLVEVLQGLRREAADSRRAGAAGKDQRRIKDDLDRDLLPVFLDEARELVSALGDGLRRWKSNPADQASAMDLRRHLHTLKGGARMTGLMRLGELAHVLETRIVEMLATSPPPARQFEDAEDGIDRFSAALERLSRGEDLQDLEVPVAAVLEQQRDRPAPLAAIAAAADARARERGPPAEPREAHAAPLRVNAELVDRFVNEAGELAIARSRIECELGELRRALSELSENVTRMRMQLREIETAAEGQMQDRVREHEEQGAAFDPLELDRYTRVQELTRFLAESLGDLVTLQQGLRKNVDESDRALQQQARLSRHLQQGLMGVRLVPLANLADRFHRVVRQAAKDAGKNAGLVLKGAGVELDRSVLEKVTAPFEHLLRNAVVHGIEAPHARLAAAKPEAGEIVIDAVQRGAQVVFTVSDDGGGLDSSRIRERAVALGMLAAGDEMPDEALAALIFRSGFSTAVEVTQASGRGVGLDVVKNEITSLGGYVELASRPGHGTTFTITVPLTLAVTQAVILRAGNQTYAIPSAIVDQVQEYRAQAHADVAVRGEIDWNDNRYPLYGLSALLRQPGRAAKARKIPVLLLRSGVQRVAVGVDEIVGNREVVVKAIGPQLARLAGVAGATVTGEGQVVLMLNPIGLVHGATGQRPAVPAAPDEERLEDPAVRPRARRVLVVDDSLTVRTVTGRLLAREGYEVVTAKDGIDALQQLQDARPDVILLDVEMPRMDGFEFARTLREDDATKSIPVIMVTSRTAQKHRDHAAELGVREYLGKPFEEAQLLGLVARHARDSAPD